MRTRRSAIAPIALGAAMLAASLGVGATATAQTMLSATLSGPAQGGSGNAMVNIDPGAGTLCYDLTVTLTPAASAAHIHRGEAGANGPIAVPFQAPSSGSASGCVEGVDAAVIADILANPAGFYVNVHNSDFPGGAIRGQLSQ